MVSRVFTKYRSFQMTFHVFNKYQAFQIISRDFPTLRTLQIVQIVFLLRSVNSANESIMLDKAVEKLGRHSSSLEHCLLI